MKLLFIVFISHLLFITIDLIAHAAVAFYLNLAVRKIVLFNGPRCTLFRVKETPICIGILPLGAWIEFQLPASPPPPAFQGTEQVFEQPSRAETLFFEWLHPLEKILVILSGAIVIFTLISLILTPQKAALSILTGFEQVVRGSFDTDYGRMLAGKLEASLEQQSILGTTAILFAKFLAFNFLPFPHFYGGYMLKEVIILVTKRSFEWSNFWMTVGFLLAFISIIRWSLMLVSFAASVRDIFNTSVLAW